MERINEESLKKVSGGKLDETTEDQLMCYLRLQKDMGSQFEDVFKGITNDYNNQIEYYDLIDTDGNKVTLDALEVYAREIWDSI
ncbi:MAG: hypothetical protein J6S49_00650 [Erysipelotrichaceae bacterium]|nr:hypothetical protein [Erysipelotrichaceae bacterium]